MQTPSGIERRPAGDRAVDPAGGLQLPPRSHGNGRGRGAAKAASAPVLPPEESAALRDRLLDEITGLSSPGVATNWAQAALAAKNRLTADDATVVAAAFEQRLAAWPPVDDAPKDADVSIGGPTPQSASPASDGELSATGGPDGAKSTGIDKSALAIPAPRRYRDREHLRHVAKQPCLICGRKPSDPHHLRYLQPRALGRKASDEFAVPLCRIHHRLVHRVGNEAAWWQDAGIDPIKAARKLWEETRRAEEPVPVAPPLPSKPLASATPPV